VRGWALLALAGCAPAPGYDSLPPADYARFVAAVQPVLAARCANPTCHGRPDRPLEVFAPHLHRLDARRLFLDEPLTDEELRRNYDRARAFVADECLLLTKPLAGGARHGGGAQFADEEEAEWRTLRDWVEAALWTD
jgi:hypothetical protein